MWGQTKCGFKTSMGKKIKSRTCILCPEGYWDPILEPGLGKVSVSERLVAGLLSLGSGQAQPEKETWVRPHVGPSPTGGASRSGAMWISGLGGPIPGY